MIMILWMMRMSRCVRSVGKGRRFDGYYNLNISLSCSNWLIV